MCAKKRNIIRTILSSDLKLQYLDRKPYQPWLILMPILFPGRIWSLKYGFCKGKKTGHFQTDWKGRWKHDAQRSGVFLTSFEVFEISSNAVLRCLIYFLNFNQTLVENAKIYPVLTEPFVSLKNKRIKLESQYISRELCLISLSLKWGSTKLRDTIETFAPLVRIKLFYFP